MCIRSNVHVGCHDLQSKIILLRFAHAGARWSAIVLFDSGAAVSLHVKVYQRIIYFLKWHSTNFTKFSWLPSVVLAGALQTF